MATALKKLQQPETITLLDKGCEFHGKLSFEGVVRIDGSFHGEIFSHDHLIIGEGAKVEGTIQVGKVEIGGQFKGKIIAKDSLIVHSTGRIDGELQTREIQAEPGAWIDGTIEMAQLRSESHSTELKPLGERVPSQAELG